MREGTGEVEVERKDGGLGSGALKRNLPMEQRPQGQQVKQRRRMCGLTSVIHLGGKAGGLPWAPGCPGLCSELHARRSDRHREECDEGGSKR